MAKTDAVATLRWNRAAALKEFDALLKDMAARVQQWQKQHGNVAIGASAPKSSGGSRPPKPRTEKPATPRSAPASGSDPSRVELSNHREAVKYLKQQKEILASMIATGQKNTAQYREQKAAVIAATQAVGMFGEGTRRVDRLSNSLTGSMRAAKALAKAEQEALAAIIANGGKGSEAYERQRMAAYKARQEVEKLETAAAQAAKASASAADIDMGGGKKGGMFSRFRRGGGDGGGGGLPPVGGGGGGGIMGSLAGAIPGGGAVAALGPQAAAVAAVGIALKKTIDIGAEFEDQLADMQSIIGATDEETAKLGERARELGIKWGVRAVEGVDAFKLVISALGPEVAQNQDALNSMGNSVLMFSKAGGVDAAGATAALTVTLSQFGYNTLDAAGKAEKMVEIANILAAASKEGAAEIPDLSESMKVAGATAKNAGLSVAETAAAAELLAPAGIKGAEAGTVLRNVLLKMSAGTKQGAESLASMGLTFDDINPKAVGFQTGLERLKQGMEKIKDPVQRATIMKKLFGLENANGAMLLMESSNQLDDFTSKIVNTTAAEEMAATKGKTFNAHMAQMKVKLEDIAIEIFQALKPALDVVIEILGMAFEVAKPFIAVIGWIISAFAGLVKWVWNLQKSFIDWAKSTTFVQNVMKAVQAAVKSISEWFKNKLLPALKEVGQTLRGAFTAAWEKTKSILSSAWGIIKKVFTVIWDLHVAVAKGIAWIVTFGGKFTWLKDKISGVVQFIKDLVGWIGKMISKVGQFVGLSGDAQQQGGGGGFLQDIVNTAVQTGEAAGQVIESGVVVDENTPDEEAGGGSGGKGGKGGKDKEDPFDKKLEEVDKANERAIAQLKLRATREKQTEAQKQKDLLTQEIAYQKARLAAAQEFSERVGEDMVLYHAAVMEAEEALTKFLKEEQERRREEERKIAEERAREYEKKEKSEIDGRIRSFEMELRQRRLEEKRITGETETAEDERYKVRRRILQLEKKIAEEKLFAEKASREERDLMYEEYADRERELEEDTAEKKAAIRAKELRAVIDAEKAQWTWRKAYTDAAIKLVDILYAHKDKAREEDLQKELAAIRTEEDATLLALKNKEISFSDYDRKIRELQEKRLEAEAKGGAEKFEFDKAIQKLGVEFTGALEEERRGKMEASRTAYWDYVKNGEERAKEWAVANGKDYATKEEAIEAGRQAVAQQANDARKTAINDLVAYSAVKLGEAAATGENLTQAAIQAALDAAIGYLNAMIPVWVAGALGTEVSKLGVVGLLTATAAITAVTLAGQAAKSALASTKFHDGTAYAGEGRGPKGMEFPALLQVGEPVINNRAADVGRNRTFLDIVNRSRMPIEAIPEVQHAVLARLAVPPRLAIERPAVAGMGDIQTIPGVESAVREQTAVLGGQLQGIKSEQVRRRREEKRHRDRTTFRRGGRYEG